MIGGFKKFLLQGNVLALAVAVIIGAAFASIVTSLTDDLIMPVIGLALGGLDLNSHFALLGSIPAGYAGSPTDYLALKKAGAAVLGYGAFVTALIKFVILAFVIYMLVRAANRATGSTIGEDAGPSEDTLLLRDIRDSLAKRA